jgi:hypothetical protein
MTLSTLAERSLPALFYSLIFVGESHVHTPYSPRQDGNYIKSIIGKPFCGESDRLASTIFMALREDEMKAQIEIDWITFSCRPLRKGKSNQLFLLENTLSALSQMLLKSRLPSTVVSMLLAAILL